MGSLRDFDLRALKERFRLRVLVETGTGEGHSLRHALEVTTWDEVHSIEVDPNMYGRLVDVRGAKLWFDHSSGALPPVLSEIAGKGPAIFWLDAHFPGELSGKRLDAEPEMIVRLPLEDELTVIADNRDVSLDLFIIDDAWIYRDGIAECGDFDRRREVANVANDSFVRRILGETHLLIQDPRANGYTIAVPKLAAMYALEECLGPATSAKLREF